MMKTTFIFLGLLTLTLVTVILSGQNGFSNVILSLAALKFLGISFYFMELYKAHWFWKLSLILLLTTFMFLVIGLRT